MSFHVPEKYRILNNSPMASDSSYGNKGAFYIPTPYFNKDLLVVATDGSGEGMGWQHVSVSLPKRCPNWLEMCMVKDFFWDEEDAVFQLHPPKSMYINTHPHCLHLWKPPVGIEIPIPPSILVGV